MKLSRRGALPFTMACSLLAPISVQAASWDVQVTGGDYEVTNTDPNPDVTPFRITDDLTSGTANTLVLRGGNVGLGTIPPVGEFNSRFYVYDPTPDIELDDWDDNRTWQIFADGGNLADPQPGQVDDPLGGIGFADVTARTNPFYIVSAAPTDSFFMDTTGFVALGFDSPEARLHVKGVDDGKILVENTPVVATSRELFEIKNNGGMSFQMTNTNASPVSTWKFVAATQQNLPGGTDSFRISKVGFGPPIFQIFDTGNAILRGRLTQNSDVNSKQDIEAVNTQSVLDKVMELPISEWSYKASPSSRHIGPMAQDFYKAFQLGDTEKGISSIDTGGVALAAIQALTAQLRAQDEREKLLKEKSRALEAQLLEQDARVQQLELAVTELLNKGSAEQKIGSVE